MRLIVGAILLLIATPVTQMQHSPDPRPTTAGIARMVLVAKKCIPIGSRMDEQHILSCFKRQQMYISAEELPDHCMNNFMQLKDRVARIHVQPGMVATFSQFVDDSFWGHNGPDEHSQKAFEREQYIRKLYESCSSCGFRRMPLE